MLEACLKATNELWGEISAKNADFKKSIDAMQPTAPTNIGGGRSPNTPTTAS